MTDGAADTAGADPWASPRGRVVTGLLLLAVGVLAVLTATVFVEGAWRSFKDSAIYLLTAESLAVGNGYSFLDTPFFVRPPGLSWVLALFMDGQPVAHESPGSGWDFRLANQVIQIGAALTIVALLLVLKRVHGWGRAALVTLLFALNPLCLSSQNTVLAEFPFLALFFGALFLLSRDDGDARPVGWVAGLAGALLLGAALYFRTVGVLMLPALVIVGLARGRPGRWRALVFSAVVVLAILPWSLHSSAARAQAERPSTQLLMFDYSTAMLRVDPSDPDSAYVDPAGWWARITTNIGHIGETMGHVFLGEEPGRGGVYHASTAGYVLTLLVALAMLYTWLSRRSLFDWTMAAYTGLILTYFVFTNRLLLPLLPMMLSSVVYSLDALGRVARRRGALGQPGAILVGAVTLAVLAMSLARIGPSRAQVPWRLELLPGDRTTSRWILRNTRPDDVLLHEKGPIFEVLTGRRTYTNRNLPGPWPEGCPEVDYALFIRPLDDEQRIADVTPGPVVIPVRATGETVRIYRFGD